VPTTIVLPPDAPAYPPALRDLAAPGRPPPTLRIRGTLPRITGVAVVGRREATREALAFTRALVQDLAANGCAIWSGGALGIDAAAHVAALEAGAPTVVVAGGGLDRPYPRENIDLFARVLAAGGALVSHLDDAAPPTLFGFLARNRVLAAMTATTVVIEAGLKSGARSTAAAARRLGRPLCVVPQAPWSLAGQGCAEELALGARAITCAALVLAALGRRARRPRLSSSSSPVDKAPGTPQPSVQLTLDPLEQAIVRCLGHEPSHIDVICSTIGAPLSAVAGALLTLTLEAVVVEGPAGCYRWVNR
jgi:DNA processing protein